MNHLNILMTNANMYGMTHNEHREHIEWINSMRGGNNNVPYGGFPPIYIIDKIIAPDVTAKKERESKGSAKIVSMKAIMKHRLGKQS